MRRARPAPLDAREREVWSRWAAEGRTWLFSRDDLVRLLDLVERGGDAERLVGELLYGTHDCHRQPPDVEPSGPCRLCEAEKDAAALLDPEGVRPA